MKQDSCRFFADRAKPPAGLEMGEGNDLRAKPNLPSKGVTFWRQQRNYVPMPLQEQKAPRIMRSILIRAIIVSLIVGSLLTLINQFERVAAFELPNLWKMGLSYVVPFCVSVFSALAVKPPPRG